MTIGGWGIAHLVLFGLLLPYSAMRGAARVDAGLATPRLRHFRTFALMQLALLLFSLRVARAEWISLLPHAWPAALPIGLGLLLLAGSYLAALPRWREAVERRDPRVHYVMPRNSSERGMWVALSLAGGIGAEVSYRGVVFALLLRLTGEPVSAALASAGFYAATQAAAGWKAIGVFVLSGLALQGVAMVSGSLYVPMLVHVGYDLLAGFTYASLGEASGYPAGGVPRGAQENATP